MAAAIVNVGDFGVYPDVDEDQTDRLIEALRCMGKTTGWLGCVLTTRSMCCPAYRRRSRSRQIPPDRLLARECSGKPRWAGV
jgi:hypothetical protein